MLSHTCKTAVKAVIYLAAKFESGEKLGIVEIAGYLAASEHTVGKMLQTLVRCNLINSHKGPSGGFFITKMQLQEPIIHIVEAIDGNQVFKTCGLGLSKCSCRHPCPIHDDYKAARRLIETLFKSKKVIDLCVPVNSGATYLFG